MMSKLVMVVAMGYFLESTSSLQWPRLLILAPPQIYGGSKQTGNIVNVGPTDGCRNGGDRDNDGKKNVDEPWNARGRASRRASRSRYHCWEGGSACKFRLALQYLCSLLTCSYVDVVQKFHCFCVYPVEHPNLNLIQLWNNLFERSPMD